MDNDYSEGERRLRREIARARRAAFTPPHDREPQEEQPGERDRKRGD